MLSGSGPESGHAPILYIYSQVVICEALCVACWASNPEPTWDAAISEPGMHTSLTSA